MQAGVLPLAKREEVSKSSLFNNRKQQCVVHCVRASMREEGLPNLVLPYSLLPFQLGISEHLVV